jgi:hypothetical protein
MVFILIKIKNRVVSLLLALAMAAGLFAAFPLAALAADDDNHYFTLTIPHATRGLARVFCDKEI